MWREKAAARRLRVRKAKASERRRATVVGPTRPYSRGSKGPRGPLVERTLEKPGASVAKRQAVGQARPTWRKHPGLWVFSPFCAGFWAGSGRPSAPDAPQSSWTFWAGPRNGSRKHVFPMYVFSRNTENNEIGKIEKCASYFSVFPGRVQAARGLKCSFPGAGNCLVLFIK